MDKKRGFAPVYLTLILILLYLPIVVVVLYSFNANTSRFTFHFTGFSLQYYEGLLHDTKGLVAALMTSLELAVYSCGIKIQLIEALAACLTKMGKRIKVSYF